MIKIATVLYVFLFFVFIVGGIIEIHNFFDWIGLPYTLSSILTYISAIYILGFTMINFENITEKK